MKFKLSSLIFKEEASLKPKLESVIVPSAVIQVPKSVDSMDFTRVSKIDQSVSIIRPDSITIDPEVEQWFDSLLDQINKPGYDFMEFYEAVADVEDEKSYKMVFTVSSGFDKTITKERLISESAEYINVLNEAVKNMLIEADSKKSLLGKDISARIAASKLELDNLRVRISDLEKLIPQLENDLNSQVSSVDNKVSSLHYFSTKLIESITKVAANIQKFI